MGPGRQTPGVRPKAAAPKGVEKKEEPKRADAKNEPPDLVSTLKPTQAPDTGTSIKPPQVTDPGASVKPQPAPTEGTLVWTGDLDTGQEIDLGSNSIKGSLSGTLPGVPVTVEVHPAGVRIVTAPGTDNRWRHLVVHNDGKKQVMVLVKWSVLQ